MEKEEIFEQQVLENETLDNETAQARIPSGFKVGHAGNGITGVSVVICEKGAVCGCDVRGGAPGTRETDLLKSEKAMETVQAVVLSGGSAYGLESACGVMEYLREKGIGYKTANKIVPIVPAAVIYDLNGDGYDYPDKEMGKTACKNAKDDEISCGRVGAGTGATVGKIRGPKHADPSGLGIATVKVMGVTVTALMVVNAMGDVYDAHGNIIAGARDRKGGYLNTKDTVISGNFLRLTMGTNTTIGCVMTDAKISKVEANKLATIAQNGLARSINPVHTDYDGDTVFCMASGKKKVINLALLYVAVTEAVSKAIENAVLSSKEKNGK
ncbi:MAG: P1 family peptidase [Clostridia bacterium]|nr:P1 family peptidase [Clostridia bacterium]